MAVTYLLNGRRKGIAEDEEYRKLVSTTDESINSLSTHSTPVIDDNEEGNSQADGEDIEKNLENIQQPIALHHHQSFISYLRQELQFDIRVAGLAGLYVVQKQFLYLAMSNLDAAVFQVTYQIKTLLTAVFSVVLLKRTLSARQIAALAILTLGVAIVQLDKVEENASKSYQKQNRWVGLFGVLAASCTSGFGGVYFELVLKPRSANSEDESTPQKQPSVWAKNVQLSTFGLIIALITAYGKDGKSILMEGFFQGYTYWVVAVILFQAMGGLIVAAVIKYADNILKSFAAAMSIAGSTIISAWVFDFSISQIFACGCILQFFSIWLFAQPQKVVEDDTNGGNEELEPLNDENVEDIEMEEKNTDQLGPLIRRPNSHNDTKV